MRPLSSLERLLERAFERPSARLFRTPLSVVVIERRIERAMEVERRRVEGRTVVPDLFAVAIRRHDLEVLAAAAGGEDLLAARLADAALAFARGHGYAPARRPAVSLVVDPTVPVGDVRVAATYSVAAARTDDAAAPAPHGARHRGPVARSGGGDPTLVLPTVAPPGPPLALLVVREPGGRVRHVPLDGSPVVIGRDAACDVVLDDRRASRRHARIQAREAISSSRTSGARTGRTSARNGSPR